MHLRPNWSFGSSNSSRTKKPTDSPPIYPVPNSDLSTSHTELHFGLLKIVMCVCVSVHLCTLVQARVDICVFLDCYVVFEIRSLKDSAMLKLKVWGNSKYPPVSIIPELGLLASWKGLRWLLGIESQELKLAGHTCNCYSWAWRAMSTLDSKHPNHDNYDIWLIQTIQFFNYFRISYYVFW